MKHAKVFQLTVALCILAAAGFAGYHYMQQHYGYNPTAVAAK